MAQLITPDIVYNKIVELVKSNEDEKIQNIVLDFIQTNKKRTYSLTQESIVEIFIKSCINTRNIKDVDTALVYYSYITESKLDNYVKMINYTKEIVEEELKNYPSNLNSKTEETKISVEDENPENFLTLALETYADTTENKAETKTQIIRFVWDIYKLLFNLTKKNNKLLEHSYKILKSALIFCKRFNLRAEFKRLCDSVRGYLQNLLKPENKNLNVPNKIEISNSDVMKTLIQIRSAILETAVELQQWQEAFKTAEDIMLLLNKLNNEQKVIKQIPDRFFYEYFMSLATLFENCKYYLFSSFAQINVRQYYLKQEKLLLQREKEKNIKAVQVISKTISSNNLKLISNKIVLFAILSIYDSSKTFAKLGNEIFEENNLRDLESNEKIMNVLKMNFFPNKEYLINYIKNNDILPHCNSDLKALFDEIFENNQNSIGNNNNVSLVFKFVKNSLKLISNLFNSQNLTDLLLCQEYRTQISQSIIKLGLLNLHRVYKSISFKRILSIFVDQDLSTIETIAVNLTRKLKANIRIDYKNSLFILSNPITYDHKFYLNKLEEIRDNTLTTEIHSLKADICKCLGKMEADGLTNHRIRSEVIRTAITEASKLESSWDDKINTLKYLNIQKENDDRLELEKKLISAKMEEQDLKERHELEMKFRKYLVDKISEFSNSISINPNKPRIRIADLYKDLDKVDSDMLFQAYLEEEANFNDKKKRLHKIINKKIDYDERIKRKIELANFKDVYVKNTEKVIEVLENDAIRKKKIMEVLGGNMNLLDNFFSEKLASRENDFKNFIKLRKQYSYDKSKNTLDQVFYFVLKDATEIKEEYEKEEEKKGTMNIYSKKDKKKENAGRGMNFKEEIKKVESTGPILRSVNAIPISEPARENKETKDIGPIIRGAKFNESNSQTQSDVSPMVFSNSSKTEKKDTTLNTEPVSTGFNRSSKADTNFTKIQTNPTKEQIPITNSNTNTNTGFQKGSAFQTQTKDSEKPQTSTGTGFNRQVNTQTTVKVDDDKSKQTTTTNSGFNRQTTNKTDDKAKPTIVTNPNFNRQIQVPEKKDERPVFTNSQPTKTVDVKVEDTKKSGFERSSKATPVPEDKSKQSNTNTGKDFNRKR